MGENQNVTTGPRYEVVPLKCDEIGVAAVQMNPKLVDARSPAQGVKENLEHMLFLCDAAVAWPPGPVHLLCFPEFTLSGIDTAWT